ncbi:TPA: hypothetical protein RQJ59_001789 [Vibrio vulnificus]|nr:hypothetical protein [Vibrio vulnificus]
MIDIFTKFDELNALSRVTQPDDHKMSVELEEALAHFIDTCIDYRLDNQHSTHYINQLVAANQSDIERNISLSSMTGLKPHVINTFIRQQLVSKIKELANERDRVGGSFNKLYF